LFTDAYISDVYREILDIRNTLEHRLEDAERKLANQAMAESLCKQRLEYDEKGNKKTPDCRIEEHNTMNARREQKAARNCLDTMNEYMLALDKQLETYNQTKIRFEDFLNSRNQDTISLLAYYKRLGQDYLTTEFDYHGTRRPNR
jgi:hypothetical protein